MRARACVRDDDDDDDAFIFHSISSAIVPIPENSHSLRKFVTWLLN